MDEVITAALRAIGESGPDDPARFFETLTETLTRDEQPPQAHDLVVTLTDGGFPDTAEVLDRYLADNDSGEILRKLAEERPDALAAEYERLQTEPAEAQPYDEGAWHAHLAEYGPGWNGQPDSWQDFRVWFQYYADENGLSSPATTFLDYAESSADAAAVFAQYGITVGAPAADDDVHARFDEIARAAGHVPPQLVDDVSRAFAAVVQEIPEAAELTAADLADLLATDELTSVLAELSGADERG